MIRFCSRSLTLIALWQFVCCSSIGLSQTNFDTAGYQSLVEPFFQEHCVRCHAAESAEGDFQIATHLTLEFSKAAVNARWSEVVNALNSHEMPPQEEPQPDAEQVAKIVQWIRQQLILAEQANRRSEVVFRRLNRTEYKNTIRDLIGVDFDISRFPQDPTAGGFDNNGRALSASPLQVELYLSAAQQILDEAIVSGSQPKPISWRFEPETGDSDSNRVRYGTHNAIVNGGRNRLDVETRVLHHQSWDRTINARDFAVPVAGPYVVRIRAGSMIPSRETVVAYAEKHIRDQRQKEMQEHPERRKWIEAHLEEEIDHFRLSRMYDYGPGRLKVTMHLNGQPTVIGEFDVDATRDAMKVFELPVKMTTAKAGITLEYAYHIPSELENHTLQGRDDFPRPEVAVDWFELAGPVYPVWPPAAHTKLLGEAASMQPNQNITVQQNAARNVLTQFMRRAYRRPVSEAEVAEKLALFPKSGADPFHERIKIPLVAVLVSPNFLYLAEPVRTAVEEPLSPFEVATRLSYFLWSTMPDDELFRAAARNELSSPEQLRKQVDRMLADPRSRALGENFAAQWLGLRDVGANPPVPDVYRHYNDHVEASLVRQSIAYFNDVLDNDRPVTEFIDSDHEILNEVLARYYELPPVSGDQMQRVKLPPAAPRGGVLTHGSILTVTSNGTRTSPVKRGTWLLKTILGSDPGLPVANAGDIAPKVPGIDKATVRKRLEIHRQLSQCARCHNKIDPLGFALENFDASGRYREQEGFGYKGRINKDDPLIDASGELPDGTQIRGIDDLKAAILKQQDKFIHCLVEKLFSYALGREMLLSDSQMLDDMIVQLQQTSEPAAPTLRSIIHSIVMSPTFVQR